MRRFARGSPPLTRLLACALSLLLTVPFSQVSQAQVAPKAVNTRIIETTRAGLDLGSRTTQVTEPSTNITTTAITGGTRPSGGPNLFHSFDFFTVGSKDIAHFQNRMFDSVGNPIDGLPTTNIIARVIGDAAGLREASTIDGILRTNNPLNALDPLNFGAANLFLVNPAGMIFGPNASLDIKGSFAAATADYLRMTDGAQFHTDPVEPSLLSIANVAAFGFTSPQPVAISIQGSTLQVASSQSLRMVGGDFTMTGGMLQAPSGQIQIAGVASAGEVIPSIPGQPADLGVGSFSAMAPVTLSGGANLDANGNGSGTVLIRGGGLALQGGSVVQAVTTGAVDGAPVAIDINLSGAFTANQGTIQAGTTAAGRSGDVRIASESLTVENFSRFGQETIGSGNTGDFSVTTGDLTMRQGGQIVVSTGGTGSTGNFTVTADSASLSSTDNATRPAGLFGGPAGGSSGGSRDMRVTVTDALEVRDGAVIDNSTSGIGNSGALEINAGSILLSGRNARGGFAAILNRAIGSGGGDAGPVEITTGTLEVRSGAQITTSSAGVGDGGDIRINADRILLTPANTVGVNSSLATGIFARGNIGAGGDVLINAGTLEVLDGANFSVSSTRAGAGGVIDIAADRVLVSGVSPAGGRAGITSQSDSQLAMGHAGDVRISSGSVEVRDGGQISVAALGPGASGNLLVNADSVVLSGGRSGLDARFNASTQTSAKGGNIEITADSLEVSAGAVIQASTLGASAIGDGGSITVNADQVLVSGVGPTGNAAAISARSAQGSRGNAGNILIDATNVQVSEGFVSASTTGVGNAGGIQIRGTDVTLVQAGSIVASTSGAGNAGDLSISALGSIFIDPYPSGVFANTFAGGSAGRILVTTPNFDMVGGVIQAQAFGNGNAGSIEMNVGRMNLVEGGQIASATFGAGRGGSIVVNGSESVSMSGFSFDGFQSGLFSSSEGSGPAGTVHVSTASLLMSDAIIEAVAVGSGKAGDVRIETSRTELLDGSQVLAATFGPGQGGNITVIASELASFSGLSGDGIFTSGLSASSLSSGNAGSITLDVGRLSVTDGAQISSTTQGAGQGGSISVTATDSVTLENGIATVFESFAASGIFSSTFGQADAGNISFAAKSLEITGGAVIDSSTQGGGRGGTITVNATDKISIRGLFSDETSGANPSGIVSSASADGSAGLVSVAADFVELLDGARLDSSTKAGGNAGQVVLSTRALSLDNAFIKTNTEGAGTAGDITVNADSAILINAAQITSSSTGTGIAMGAAGAITIEGENGSGTSAELVSVTNSSVLTSAAGDGKGGSILVRAGDIRLDGATVSATANAGNAGSVTLITTGPSTFTALNSSITTEATTGAGGSIAISSPSTIELKNSNVSASVTGGDQPGGSINLMAPTVTITGGAIIGGGAVQAITRGAGPGGNITVDTERLSLVDKSDINVSSFGAGRGGTITVNARESVLLSDGSLESVANGSGDAGQIVVTTPSLAMTETVGDPLGGSSIRTLTNGSGNAGNVTLNVGTASLLNTDIQASVGIGASGRGGSIVVQGQEGPGTWAERLDISGPQGAAFISASTFGSGNAGSLDVVADTVILRGGGPEFVGLSTQVSTQASGAPNAGNLRVSANKLELRDGGQINAGLFAGSGRGGSVDVTAESIFISGFNSRGFVSGISTATNFPARGNAGNIVIVSDDLTLTNFGQINAFSNTFGNGGSIDIRTGTLTATNGAFVTSTNFGAGTGGNVTIEAESIRLQGPTIPALAFTTPGIFSIGGVSATGAGNITLRTGSLELLDGGQVTARTNGRGAGGTIDITADSVTISGQDPKLVMPEGTASGIYAGTRILDPTVPIFVQLATGNAGNINMHTGSLNLQNGGTVEALSDSAGNAGSVNVTANTLTMNSNSSITTEARRQGDAGAVTLNVGTLTAQGDSQITSSSIGTGTGRGDAGNVTVQGLGGTGTAATSATLNNSDLLTSAAGDGQGGSIVARAGEITLLNGANVSATANAGNAGSVTLITTGPSTFTSTNSSITTEANTGAGGSIIISSPSSVNLSGTSVSAKVKGGSQPGGDITITAGDEMTLSNGTVISAQSGGLGNAGTITLNAGSQFLSTNGSVTTEATQTSGGNITVLATDMMHLKNSRISASVHGGSQTAGGNIFIDPQFVILQNSRIVAQAFQGQGGNINIVANTFLPDANSLVSASSQFGLSGTVNIQAPLQNLAGALVPLRQDYLRSATLLGQRCAARGADTPASTFLVTEHEGLPQEPGGVLPAPLMEVELPAAELPVSGAGFLVASAGAPDQFQIVDHVCRR